MIKIKISLFKFLLHRLTIAFILPALLLSMVSCRERNPSVKVLDHRILQHPRLLYTGQEVKPVAQLLKTESLAGDLQKLLIKEANQLLSAPLQEHKLRDLKYMKDLLHVSRQQVYRMITLSLAYRHTGDKRYAQKAEEEIVNVCNFPDWNPRHYLDVAEMTTAVAIGYDWLYDVFSPETKKIVVSAIKSKALDLALKEYGLGEDKWWSVRENNWNVVCNTGMVMGALAVAEHYPDETGLIIENAVKNVPNCLKHLAPDGVCYEGPGYWGYTNTYLVLLLKALKDNFGHDFGLSELEGIDKTLLYYIHCLSPSEKVFNFGNVGGASPDTEPFYFFYSKYFNQPEAAAYYRQLISSQLDDMKPPRFFFLSIPWFDNAAYETRTPLPKLKVYKGVTDIAVFNGDKNARDFIYLITKGGNPNRSHQHLDVGTFIVETNGVRWSDDLGADTYSVPGVWEYRPDGRRWNYFRNSNFSHNTLSIDNKIQYSDGTGKVIAYDDKAEQPYATIDMSTLYTGRAKSVHRTFRLLDNANILVTDSVELNAPAQSLQWSMITAADVSCRGNVAELTRDGQRFYLNIITPSSAKFTTKEAKPATEYERPVEGYRLLTMSTSGKQHQVIEIQMSSINPNMNTPRQADRLTVSNSMD